MWGLTGGFFTNAGGTVVTFDSGEGPDSVLEGFTVTGGRSSDGGGGLLIDRGFHLAAKGSAIFDFDDDLLVGSVK